MTDEYALGQLVESKLEWHEHPNGGFVATKNGITLHLTGSPESFIVLTIADGYKRIAIHEPRVPLWKKPPPSKILLNALIKQATEQNAGRYTEEYQTRLRNELLGKLTGWNC